MKAKRDTSAHEQWRESDDEEKCLVCEGDTAKDFHKPPWMEIPTGKTWVVTKMLAVVRLVTQMQEEQIDVKLLHRQCFLCLCAQNWANLYQMLVMVLASTSGF